MQRQQLRDNSIPQKMVIMLNEDIVLANFIRSILQAYENNQAFSHDILFCHPCPFWISNAGSGAFA
jgi:hypothetical protein